jgi:hypothetical protein
LWDWGKTKRERQVLTIQKDIIQTKKETFDKTLIIALQSQTANINKYEQLIIKDNEIIELRSKITKSASSQLENGVITSTDYLTELNAETLSKINLETHKIQLLQTKVNYLTIKGDL